jgi:hypothetical protein
MFHVGVIRSKLTQNIVDAFKEGHEERIMATDDLIPMLGDGTWKVLGIKVMVHRACRMGYAPYSKDP